MPTLRNDRDLLMRFRRGERPALERVYWTYVERVERMLRQGFSLISQGGTFHIDGLRADDVADLVQETFARAFGERARLAYDGLRDYGPFLLTIARNLLVDRARKQGRELPAENLEQLGDEPDEPPYADDETVRSVGEYVSALGEPMRGIHQQRFVLGVSQEQAARALGLSRQQVRTLEKRLCDGLEAHLLRAGLLAAEEAPTETAASAYTRKGL
jgi:RNA polymerase sigma-70 factor (ECF subfamily)